MAGRKSGSWFLAIDLGTGSCKTVVVNEKAQVLGFGSSDYAATSFHQKWHKQSRICVLPGISFRFPSVYDVLAEITPDIRQIRASGGFVNSPFWLQMTSDVLNRELVVPAWGETSSLGAAFWAMKGRETLSSVNDIQQLIPIRQVCQPEVSNVETYDRLYELYRDLYAALSAFFVQAVPVDTD